MTFVFHCRLRLHARKCQIGVRGTTVTRRCSEFRRVAVVSLSRWQGGDTINPRWQKKKKKHVGVRTEAKLTTDEAVTLMSF